jgi:hypothetical protein
MTSETPDRRPLDLLTGRGATVATTVAAVLLAAGAAVVAPAEQTRRHYDHVAYEAAVGFVRDGRGLYQGSMDGLLEIGASVDQARAVRQPWLLGAWSVVPEGWLQPLFFGVVVLGSTLLAIRLVRYKPVALLVGTWAATAGVFYGVDAWLLFELWAVPCVLGSAVAWVGRRDWLAAACCVAACAIRETAVLLPLGYLASAIVVGRPWRPWAAGLATSAALLAVHWGVAAGYLDPDGASAPLLGTGSLEAVVWMTSFLVLPDLVGLALWCAGLLLLWRSALRPTVALALMPLFGLVVNRPYWGFLAMPLCVVALGGLPPVAIIRAPAGTPPRS